ncbi:MAG: YicC family protein [Lachnospiraceae bacterium]|nr:YicC family protein [Lachnospiraceae bacterium]
MARSMTGFGRSEYADEKLKLAVEMKSVNNRYLDFNIRMPKKFNAFEAKIRAILQEYMYRGKVDVFISYANYEDSVSSLRYNEALADEYLSYLLKISEKPGVAKEIRISDIARFPDVFTMEEVSLDEESVWPFLEKVLREAAEKFAASREIEGEHLKSNILEKLEDLYKGAEEVEKHEPEIIKAYQDRLLEKMQEILEDSRIDEARITQEAAMFADRISTDEESVRLKSHVVKMRAELEKTGSIGKGLDFLVQEMNREANTMLSKAGDIITSDIAIGMKTGIEKIREQIQNIE